MKKVIAVFILLLLMVGLTGDFSRAGGPIVMRPEGSGSTQAVTGPLTDTQLRATAVPVSGTVTAATPTGTVTDRSGSITTGGTAQQLMAANSSRKYLFIQNVSAADLWINFTTTAVADSPSIKLASGNAFFMESSFVSTEAISIIGATTGQKWTAKEG